MDKKITTCFVAGRSGGHIIPALTLAQTMVTKNPLHDIIFFTTNAPLDCTIIASGKTKTLQHIALDIPNVPGKNIFRWVPFLYRVARACYTSWRTLRAKRPDCVISMGGYVSIPVCFAARLLNIPIRLMELNVEPGQATTFLASWANSIDLCFEETRTYLPAHTPRCATQPYPVRFSEHDKTRSKQDACMQLGLDPRKKIILVLGGSQGSLFVNTTIKEWATKSDHTNLHIAHQIGGNENLTTWKQWYQDRHLSADVFIYRHDMALLYAAADLVVCRSGAGTLFETLFFEKRCITIPLETATNTHQVANALALQKKFPTLVTVLSQNSIIQKPELFNQTINTLL